MPLASNKLSAFMCGFFVLLGSSTLATAQEADGLRQIDTEHLFGLLEGSDVGKAGDMELETSAIGEAGRPSHFFSAETDTSLRVSVTDQFRVSVGFAFDLQSSRGVDGIANHDTAELSGVPLEFRYQLVDHETAPFGLSFTVAPSWRRLSAESGRLGQYMSVPAGFLLDFALLPERLYFGANLVGGPNYAQVSKHWKTGASLEVGGALSYQVSPGLFVSGEVRRDYLSDVTFLEKRATFVGSGLTWFWAPGRNLKGFVSQQIGGPFGPINLHDFSRTEFVVQVASDL